MARPGTSRKPRETKTGRADEVVGVNQSDHPLHAHFCGINRHLRRLGMVPGMLTVEDVHRMAAQLLLECWLVGMEQIQHLAVNADEQLVAWQDNLPDVGGRLSVTLDVMQALSYSVAETTLALEEVMAAWPLTALQRRALQREGGMASPLKAGIAQGGAGRMDLSVR